MSAPPAVDDALLHGAVDLHAHVDVEFSTTLFRKSVPEWRWLPRAEESGMRAVVLKSHLWPTAPLAPYLAEVYKGPVDVLTSITLNPTVGGLDPWAVEAAAHMGARAVFLPTWGARSDRERGGFHRRLAGAFTHFDPERLSVLSVTDAQGDLVAEAHEVLRLAAEHDMLLSTGHLSWRETLVLAKEAVALGFERLVFGHPLSHSVGAPLEAMREAASLGAFLEFCWPTVAPGRHDPGEVVRVIREVGASRTVLSSDYFRESNPPPPDLLRLLLGTLHDAGLTEQEMREASATNPAALLGLPP